MEKEELKMRKLAFPPLCYILLVIALLSVAIYKTGGLEAYLGNKVIRPGDSGAEVWQVQQKLIGFGYLHSSPNGIYDKKTLGAVKQFQRENGLKPNGIVDQMTKESLGVFSSPNDSFDEDFSGGASWRDDVNLLARTINAEARGEPYIGQVAVGAVVLNRTKHSGFPKTLTGVIYQPWAFTAVHDGQINMAPSKTAYRAAQDAIGGWDPSSGAVYYYNPRYISSNWILSRPVIKTIGNHVFCR